MQNVILQLFIAALVVAALWYLQSFLLRLAHWRVLALIIPIASTLASVVLFSLSNKAYSTAIIVAASCFGNYYRKCKSEKGKAQAARL